MLATSSSNVVVHQQPPQHKVFINFRGELRYSFISHLQSALETARINVFTDNHERNGTYLNNLLQRIEESRIAIVVISGDYTASEWCLKELEKIKECVEAKRLVLYPVFYKVEVSTVKRQEGTFGEKLTLLKPSEEKKQAWEQALQFAASIKGQTVGEKSEEGQVVGNIVKDVIIILNQISEECITDIPRGRESEWARVGKEAEAESIPSLSIPSDDSQLYGIETMVKQLQQKLELESVNVIRVIGIVGMPGIGKTTLAKKLLSECGHKFLCTMFLDDVHQKSKTLSYDKLHEDLLFGLWKSQNDGKECKFLLKPLEDQLKKNKVFVVLDDVSDKSQIDGILGERSWIKAGSRVVIITSRRSAVQDVDDTYFVTGLSDGDAQSHFNDHAFSGPCAPSFKKLAKEFVDYSSGHPSALKLLARELHNKDESYWREKLKELANSSTNTIQDVLRIPFDELSELQKIVFLDIAYFFRFENESYVRSLLGYSSHSGASEIAELADKFLININGGRVEMNDLLYTFAMGLNSQASSENTSSRRRLSNHWKSFDVLMNKEEATKVRGIYLDMSKVSKKIGLRKNTFKGMKNLRYLKFFNSQCHRECGADEGKLNFPEGLKVLPQELRYLHWLKFPSPHLPENFNPKNLIDLKLPYSQIEQVWEGEKDTSKLQWLDLNHSSKLHSLSGFSQARKLESINLEGCTGLNTLPEVLQNMESLMFLNLKGCTSLECLPDITLVALRTLILSSCSSFTEFKLIAENLEELYLDGTAIKELPSTIGKLQRLISLKLKDCKNLLSLPDSIGDLKAIQEIILSGCSSLKTFPEVKKNLKHLKTLLLDGTAIKEVSDPLRHLSPAQGQTSPRSQCDLWLRGIDRLSSVRRLSLSRNDFKTLPTSISCLYHLNWLDLKHCEKLVYVPELPPNLQWLDAHGCISLEKIIIPSELLLEETENLHSTFIFTNCTKLDQVVKDSIVSYARKKIQLRSNALARYEKGFVLDVLMGICFPGWQVPVWFNHRSVGLELMQNLPRHWNAGGLTGIALCAVVSFENYQSQNTHLLVKCSGEFKEEGGTSIQFSCIFGGCTEHGSYESREIKSSHVFIGYTSWLHFMKRGNRLKCAATEASLKFQVTDGTREVANCTIVNCGFSLIYAPTNADHSLCTDIFPHVTPPTSGVTSSGSTTDVRKIGYQNGAEERYVPSVSSRTCDIVEEAATPLADSREIEEQGTQRLGSMDQNQSVTVSSSLDETPKSSGINGSTSEKVKIEKEVYKTTCLSFLSPLFFWRD